MKKEKSAKSKEFDIIILITYIFTLVSGIIVFLISENNHKRKFHALQAILLGIIILIVSFIPFIGPLISLVIWIYGIYIGYQGAEGRDIEIPYIGETAKKYLK